MKRFSILTTMVILTTATSAAAAQPRVLPGWPTVAGAGETLVEGALGDTIVVTDTGPEESSVASIMRNGIRRWLSVGRWACGNCDDGGQLGTALPDGSIGPVGPEGDGAWGVDASGKIVRTCLGVMLPDTTCVVHETRFGVAIVGAIVARRGNTILWENVRPPGPPVWDSGLEAPPRIVADQAGTAYTTLGATGPMVAIDTTTGVERWLVDGATPLAGLSTGVLAHSETLGLTRYRADGTVMWNIPGRSIQFHRVLVDVSRERIYASERRGLSVRSTITAWNATTGAELWRTATSDQAHALSIRTNGTLLAGIDRPNHTALRAIGADGRTRWQFDTASRVNAALGLSNGTVALTTEGTFLGQNGLVWRIDPRKLIAPTPRVAVLLRGRRFIAGCLTSRCAYKTDAGMSLRIELPRRTRLRLRLVTLGGRELVGTREFVVAPPGTSAVRFGMARIPRATTAVLEVRSTADRSVLRRFVVRIVPSVV